MALKFNNREEWLTFAGQKILDYFLSQGAPEEQVESARTFHVTCGWPSHGGTGMRKRTFGECWARKASKAGVNEVFISPTLDDKFEVLDILGHELVHAVDDCEHGHKGPFKKLCKTVGWTNGKPTSAKASGDAVEFLRSVADSMPTYPHGRMTPTGKITQDKCRLVKATCGNCGMIIRTTRAWIGNIGLPTCACGGQFEEAES